MTRINMRVEDALQRLGQAIELLEQCVASCAVDGDLRQAQVASSLRQAQASRDGLAQMPADDVAATLSAPAE